MSRNLYTIAVVVPALARELRLLSRDPDGWASGAGERALAVETASGLPRVPFYRVVLDGWGHGLQQLAAVNPSPAVRAACAKAERDGLAVIRPRALVHPFKSPRVRLLNAYAVRALAYGLNEAAAFAGSTRCPIVVLHRTLSASFDDDDFNPRPTRRRKPLNRVGGAAP